MSFAYVFLRAEHRYDIVPIAQVKHFKNDKYASADEVTRKKVVYPVKYNGRDSECHVLAVAGKFLNIFYCSYCVFI